MSDMDDKPSKREKSSRQPSRRSSRRSKSLVAAAINPTTDEDAIEETKITVNPTCTQTSGFEEPDTLDSQATAQTMSDSETRTVSDTDEANILVDDQTNDPLSAEEDQEQSTIQSELEQPTYETVDQDTMEDDASDTSSTPKLHAAVNPVFNLTDTNAQTFSLNPTLQAKIRVMKKLCTREFHPDYLVPDYDYTVEDFEKILDYKAFFAKMKPMLVACNQKLSMTKQNSLMAALFREFRLVNLNIPPRGAPWSHGKTVPPIKIRLVPNRKRKSVGNPDSDTEFEERLRQHEETQEREEREKQDRKRVRKEEKQKAKEEAVAAAELEEIEEADEIKAEKPTDVPGKQNFDEHYEFCMVCKDGGDLLLCDTCPCSYHMKCLNPPMGIVPDGDWSCPRCSALSFPEKIEKIIAWKWKDPECVEVPDNRPGKEGETRKLWGIRSRIFLVKYKNMSYWRCEWIDELRLEVHEVHLWRYWNTRTNMDEPTWTDDIDRFEEPDLAERFYKYGIHPEFLEVHRIIDHNTLRSGDNEYLVKWKNLPYSKCTWETEEDGIPEYEYEKDSEEEEEESDEHAAQVKLKKLQREWKTRSVCPDIRDQIQQYWVHRKSIADEEPPAPIGKQRRGKKKKKNKTKAKSKQTRDEAIESTRPLKLSASEKYDKQPFFIPDGLNLHEYQMEGLNWLRFSWSQDTDVILADEMGLGKTIQTICFLKSLVAEGHTWGPFLISVPLSTLSNWEREFETWAPDLYVVSYYGDKDSRQMIRQHELSFEEKSTRTVKIATKIRTGVQVKFNVLLTSYEIVSIDQATLSSVPWQCLVIDEAHRLKNATSKFFRVLMNYKVGHKLLLTGTPLQNTLEELFYLLNFLVPTKFDNLEVFLGAFNDLTKDDQIIRLHDMLGVHMLRRLKSDVLKNMPGKSEFLVRTELTTEQKKLYKACLTKNFEMLRSKSGPANTSLINIVMDLRKVCNHPYLFQKSADEAPRLANGGFEGSAMVKACGKLIVLQKMLKKLKDTGHRVLIFSQMTRLMDLLEDFLEAQGYRYERIDGSVTGGQRQESIDRFNQPNAEQFVFLLSTRAGGLGINLASADTVFIYDSDWNPHNDIQAFSRAHRLGQKNRVMIYRFVTRNSVEERIQQVAKRKMMLTHIVVRPGIGQNKGTGMTKQEMDDILKFGTEELFKDEDEDQKVFYDDAAIDDLLDRDKITKQEDDADDTNALNDYLSSFKVATYQTQEDSESEEEVEREVLVQDEKQSNAEYWENLLRHHYEHDKEEEQSLLGKGKRVRKQVQYLNLGVEESKEDVDAEIPSEHDEDDEDDDHSHKTKKFRRLHDRALPPLLSRVNGNLEVYGFSIRHRRAFLNMIMRWGLPPTDMQYDTRWYVRELRSKNDKEFNAYLALFTRHLCEPEMGHSSQYADGIPKEGMQRQQVLFRIGIMNLITKKVEEYQSLNGDWSEPSKKPPNVVQQNQDRSTTPKKDGDFNPDAMKDVVDSDSDAGSDKPTTVVSQDIDVQNDHRLHPETKMKKRFMFNIADSGFTELHTLWNTEEAAAIKAGRLKEIWHRMHDYWLIAGIAKHGYARWSDIQQDPQFSLIVQPFIAMEKKQENVMDMQKGFLQRRFKLLETALITEEELRRANLEKCEIQENSETLTLARHFNELECFAASHANLAREATSNNKLTINMLHKALQRLDELLVEMKNDLMKLPVSISQLPPIQERLTMNERYVVAHLLTASANLDEKIDENESPEVTQQREQFKEIAKKSTSSKSVEVCE